VEVILGHIECIWECDAVRKHIQLVTIYQCLVNLMPLLANPALELLPQLRALKNCSRIGSDAFVNGALADNYSSSLETLELAQSVIWSQSLYRRDPQIKDIPELLANKLQHLLQDIAMRSAAESYHRLEPASLTPHDTLHMKSSQLHALVQEIRALPGLDRFMRGENFETLRTVANDHPVVVLVGARRHYYALIITSSLGDGHTLLALDIKDQDFNISTLKYDVTQSSRGADTSEDVSSAMERLSLGKSAPTRPGRLIQYFKIQWLRIVRPVFDHLGFKVGAQNDSRVEFSLICISANARPGQTTPALVSYWRVQLRASMMELIGSLVLTMWYHRTPPPSQPFYVRKGRLYL
jgi:hypothetical protein